MTAIKGRAIGQFFKALPPKERAVLVYGPDGGLVRERALRIGKSIVADVQDPFNATEFTDLDLKGDPARLVDEAAAISFAGGDRLIRVKTAGDGAAPAAALLLDALKNGSFQPTAIVVIEGGDLKPKSKLRAAFEKSPFGAAIPCYTDGPAELRALAQALAKSEDLRFDQEALDLVVSALGEDRGLSRAEIDKVILFKGLKSSREGPETITVDDVQAVLADGATETSDALFAAIADGAAPSLEHALHQAAMVGASPIGQLRALQRSFMRLAAARAAVDAGASPAHAVDKLKPPVFFKEKAAFQARVNRWTTDRLKAALDALLQAEIAAKTTGAPQREIVERAALGLCMSARN
ncbi:MAG: DNA polymerase III subunit delta [Pseudomonadota bacterium]